MDKRRKKVIAWLNKNRIEWQKCSIRGISAYLGGIYIDVPYDENNPQYQQVRDYLENPDGTMRDESIRFYFLPLEVALKNAHDDEPEYGENLAEDF